MEVYTYIDKPRRKKYVVALNVMLAVMIAIILVLIILFSTIFATIAVIGQSMSPTLAEGDKLLLVKYGYKLQRGDIIVFQREDKANVKRILGLEGDIIQFDLDNLTWIVNGKPYNEEYVKNGYSENYFTPSNQSEKEVVDAILSKEGLTVPQGQMFVLGDNRNIQGGKVSVDSHTNGTFDTSSIIGKVIKIY